MCAWFRSRAANTNRPKSRSLRCNTSLTGAALAAAGVRKLPRGFRTLSKKTAPYPELPLQSRTRVLHLRAGYGTVFRAGRYLRCSSSVVEHSLGKGEVESSILSCSTIKSLENSGVSRNPPKERLFILSHRDRERKMNRAWMRGTIAGHGSQPVRRTAPAFIRASPDAGGTPAPTWRVQHEAQRLTPSSQFPRSARRCCLDMPRSRAASRARCAS